ncbi:MAG: hypothetical protein H7Y32_00310, partial [Chloroflexales bacterium]|nr:hypothetical protein [Chloroflexales bacterium]
YLKPFIARFASAIRRQHPGALIFLESEPLQPEGLPWGEVDPAGVVNASHWYDAITLFAKRPALRASVDVYTGRPVFGAQQVRAMFERQIGLLRQHSAQIMGNCPTLIGEFGLPYDLNGGAAFHTGDWSAHERLLGLYYDALDAHLVSATQWNYTADNDNRWGDHWNGEDLSIFSRDQQRDPFDVDSGGRATAGFCRPYARRTAGTPTTMRFDRASRTFELGYTGDPAITAPSEIYVPRIQYPNGYQATLTSGRAERDEANQLLYVYDAEGGEQRVVIFPQT